MGMGEGMLSLTGSQSAKAKAAVWMHKSSVFEHEDDPDVLLIMERKKREAEKLAARTRNIQNDVEQASVGLMGTGLLSSMTINIDEVNQNNEATHIVEQGLRRDTNKVLTILADMNGRQRDYDEVYAYLEAHLKNKNRVHIVVEELFVEDDIGEQIRSPSSQFSNGPATIPDNFKGKGKARIIANMGVCDVSKDINSTGIIDVDAKGKVKKKDNSMAIIDVDAKGKALKRDYSMAIIDVDAKGKAKKKNNSMDIIDVDAKGKAKKMDYSMAIIDVDARGKAKKKDISMGTIDVDAKGKAKKRDYSMAIIDVDAKGKVKNRNYDMAIIDVDAKGKAKKVDNSMGIIDVDATSDYSPVNEARKRINLEHLAPNQEGAQSVKVPGLQGKVDDSVRKLTHNISKIVHRSTHLPPITPSAVAIKKPPPTRTIAVTFNQHTKLADKLREAMDCYNKSSAAYEVASLASDFVAMFPDTPPDYIQARCRDIVGEPAAIGRFIEELLQSPHPPKDWIMLHKPAKTVQDTAPAGLKLQDGQLGGYVDVDKSPVPGPSSRLNNPDVDHKSSKVVRYNDPVQKKVFTPAELRTIKEDDQTFKIAWDAQNYFYSMQRQSGTYNNMMIKSVTVITNRKLANAFEAKKKYFVEKNIPANPIYAYHGTKSDPTILDNILVNNFDKKYAKRQVHGAGHYFSEFPDVSLGYGPGLIFCQLLSGKEYKGRNRTWPGFHSKVVQPSPGTGHSQMVIIEDSAQILPLCLIHLQK